MKRKWVARAGACVLASAAVGARPARAANTPRVGPVPAWVLDAPAVPPEKADLKGLPLTILLNDTQFSFDADGWTEFHAVRAKVQTPGGLQLVSAIPFPWGPWSDTLTFHRASILRDGQTIDVLPKDGAFTVLRREAGLEQAMLTGELTALLQPEGLRVGDVLEIALSIRHADPLVKGETGALFAGWDVTPITRLRLQAHWPSALPVRWRVSGDLAPLRRSEAGGVTTVALDLEDVRPPVLPAHAPARFQHGRQVEFTTLADWKAVARTMAPLYAAAAALAPGSPVAAQAALIAKAASDPKARAGAALILVQEQVRYLAHAEDSGGYTPQGADETWRLRYGDCKAKTALLLALLRELGVPAEAVLASTTGGDGLDARLPSPLLFNHVLVRARLGQKDYWLDGARLGDRNLDDLTTPAYGWVLPLEEADGRLVRVVPAPAERPQILQSIRYDASKGLLAPVGTKLTTTFRGDGAVLLHEQLAAAPPDRLEAGLKAFWAAAHSAFTAAHVAEAWDPATGEERLTAEGTSKLDGSDAGLELQHVRLGGAPDIKRDPAANDPDAPYVVDFPGYVETDESVVLPAGDTLSPTTAKQVDVDAVIAGVAYRRSATVTGQVYRVVASQRALRPEISAAEARASVAPLTKLGDEGVFAPVRSGAPAADAAAALDSHPTTLDGHLERGDALANAARYQEALSEYDAAIAIDPTSQLAWANRAIAHAWLSDPTAIADAARADALGPPEIAAARARGLLADNLGDVEGARAAYRRALTLAPDDEFSRGRLFDLELRSSHLEAARKEVGELLRFHPELASKAHLWNAWIEVAAHHQAAAERELAQAPAATSDDLVDRARAYVALGDKDLARADLDRSIRLAPNVAAWLLRADADGGYESPKAQADVDAAAKLAPDAIEPQVWKMHAAEARRDFAAALPLIDRLVNEHAEMAGDLLVERAWVEGRLGARAKMDADFSRAQALAGPAALPPGVLCESEVRAKWRPTTALENCRRTLEATPNSTKWRLYEAILLHRFGREAEAATAIDALAASTRDAGALNAICYGLAAEALALDRALAACDQSLKLRPGDARTLDSRAFVLLRLGRDAEALAAYQAALAANPKLYESLYGRALAEARLGRHAESARDTAAALAGRSHIVEDFAEMGIR